MQTLEEMEKVALLERLEKFDYNMTRAAKSLGITCKTMYNKLPIMDLTVEDLKNLRALNPAKKQKRKRRKPQLNKMPYNLQEAALLPHGVL